MSVGPAGHALGRGRSAAGAASTCGQLLRRYRSLAGLTQEQLADRSGYSANYIGKLERDERAPPAAALDRLGVTLGLGEQERAALATAGEHRDDRELTARPLAGRDREMAEIRRHLAGLGPPVLLFAGEPGMGKTRLLEEVTPRAAQSGWAVAHDGCQRRAQDLYAPLTGALTDALRRLPERDRVEVLRSAGRLDLLLPELAPAEGGPGPGDRNGAAEPLARPEEQRRLMASAAGRCLRAVSGEAGTMLVLDDLQWAGPDALDLVTALVTAAGSPAIRLVGAYRDSETAAGAQLAEFVADLARSSLIRVLRLERLSDEESGQLVRQSIPAVQEKPAVLPAIVRRAGGVPFFLVSYVDELRDSGGITPQLKLPWTVAQVTRQRVLALPGPAQDLLTVAAAVGRVVPHRLLVRVTGRTDDEVIEAVEAALDARLLAEDGQAGYRFTHDLIRETIEDGLSAPRRRLLHRRIGETLEREPNMPAETLAFHFALSDDDGKAVTYLELAGDQAQQLVAYGAAADFFQQVIGRLALDGRPQDAVPVHEKLGMALYLAGHYGAAIAPLERSLAGYRAAGDEEGVHRVTGRLADVHFRRGTCHDILGPFPTLADEDAVRSAGAGSHGAVTQLQGLARLLYARGSYKRLVTVGRSLARAGRAGGNARLQTIGKRIEGAGLIALGHLPAGTALLAATMPQDPAAGPDERAAEIAAMLSAAYLAMGFLEPSRALSARMLRQAESVKDELFIAMHNLLLGTVCYVQGDWEPGRDLVRQAQERFAAAGPSPLALSIVPVIASCLIWEGAWEEARPYLDTSLQAARSMRVIHTERAALAFLAELDLMEGRPQAALTRLQPLITKDLTWYYAISLHTTMAAAQFELGDPDRARQHAGRAVADARHTGAWVFGSRALLVQGMVEARRGNHELARAAYEEGLQRTRAMPFPYGEAGLLQASGLLDREQGNEAAARGRFSQALAITDSLRHAVPARSIPLLPVSP